MNNDTSHIRQIAFVPPCILPGYYGSKCYIKIPPLFHISSYHITMARISAYLPDAIFRNVIVFCQITIQKRHPNGYYYPSTSRTIFSKPEVTAQEFVKILKCSDPTLNYSLPEIEKCWNNVYPS